MSSTDADPGSGVSFNVRLLGPLTILSQGRDFTPSAPKVLQVFALLALRANKIVPTDTLIEELWDENPPRSANTTVQTYIYQIRRILERAKVGEDDDEPLVTKMPGYILRIRPADLDLHLFDALAAEGRELYEQREYFRSIKALEQALDLWSEGPLSNVKLGPRLLPQVINLRERYRSILQMCIRAKAACGMQADIIADLQELRLTFPYDEWIHEQLILALWQNGRRSDAMGVYRSLREVLSSQLGIDPSPEIEKIHAELLGA
ncbi:AfsR/SARP family transcriptional regulator [Actinomadura chibensis]|nr:AfsR/SARP family transcriptional regulator [Actinomadura chibensis]